MRSLVVFAFVAHIALMSDSAVASNATTRVESGQLRGETVRDVDQFLGVPYAAAPVRELRWRAPQPPSAWSGQRDAVVQAPGCMQYVTPDGFGPWTKEYVTPAPVSEDCLYANIWAPAKKTSKPKPVLVWIHGGAFMSGSNSVPIYDGSELARQGVVVVSINYRLGIFGFAAFRELQNDPGGGTNFGLQDVIASLRWIKRNIAAFGGDPDQVTIAGQSAGAMVVHQLLVSPLGDGLFARAIAQSGITDTPLPTLSIGLRRGDDLKAKAAVRNIAELRLVSAEKIMSILAAGPLEGTTQIGPVSLIGPVIDGKILPDQVDVLEVTGHQKAVPVMVGLNADEGVLNPDYFHTSAGSLRARIGNVVGVERVAQLLSGYSLATDDASTQTNKTITRLYGLASVADWSRKRVRATGKPLFAYYYTHPEPGSTAASFGAFHSAEIPYMFNSLGASPWRKFETKDVEIARIMSRYWANFAKTGNPNGTGVPVWPIFKEGKPVLMELGETFAPYKPGDTKYDLLLTWMSNGLKRSIFGASAFVGVTGLAETNPGAD